jgi:hypothetical protein
VDPGCLSRILIFIHPGSRIQDPTTATKGGGGQFVVLPFFKATNITKLRIFIVIWRRKEFEQIYEELQYFSPKNGTKLFNIWVWNPRSGIQGSKVSDPGSATLLFTASGESYFNGVFFSV